MPPGYPGGPGMPGMGQPQVPAKSNLPDDVGQWKKNEYYQARREGHPKLKEAVKLLGKTFALKRTNDAKKADQAATLLVKLLAGDLPKPETPPATQPAGASSADSSSSAGPMMGGPPPGMPGGPPPGMMGGPPPEMMGGPPGMMGGMYGAAGEQIKPLDAETIAAIVDALAVNGGSVAKKALADILSGTQKSDSDAVATRAALETLVKHPESESETTLFKAVTDPESFRPKPKTTTPQPGITSSPPGVPPGYPGMPGGPAAPGAPAESSSAAAPSADTGVPPGYPGAPADSSGSSSSAGPYPGMGPMMGPGYPGGMMGAAQAKLGPAQFQTLALAVATPVATEAFRLKVANALSETAPEYRPPLTRFLLQPNPENLAAQFVLLKGSAVDTAAKITIGSYLTTYSSQALCALLGIPTESLKAHRSRPAGATQGGPMPGYPGAGAMAPGASVGPETSSSAAPVDPLTPGAPAGMPGGPSPEAPAGVSPSDSSLGMPGGYPGMPSGYPGMPGGAYPGMPGAPGGTVAGLSRLSVVELAKQYAKDPDLAYRVGRQLWGSVFLPLALEKLDALPSIQKGAPEIMLASTVPLDSVRARLHQVLMKHHAEGPRALEAAGLAGVVTTDPGLLVVLKALPRKDLEPEKLTALQRYRREARDRGAGQGATTPPGQDPKKAKGAGAAKKGRTAKPQPGEAGSEAPGVPMPGGPMAGPDGSGAPMGGPQGGQGPEYQWMDASEKLARAMCEWFAAAAAAAAKKGIEVSEDLRPIEIPSSANVVAEYHFSWPKDLAKADGLAGVSPDPMMIHYIRMEQKTSPRKVFAYFRTGNRILRPAEHPVANGFWMESFRPVPGTDRQRSVDIFVTKKELAAKEKPGAEAGAAPGMPGPGGYPGMPGPGEAMSGPPGVPGPGGMQPGQRDPAEKDEVGDLVVEILAVEVKSPAPMPDRASAEGDEGQEGGAPAKGKSKVTTVE